MCNSNGRMKFLNLYLTAKLQFIFRLVSLKRWTELHGPWARLKIYLKPGVIQLNSKKG